MKDDEIIRKFESIDRRLQVLEGVEEVLEGVEEKAKPDKHKRVDVQLSPIPLFPKIGKTDITDIPMSLRKPQGREKAPPQIGRTTTQNLGRPPVASTSTGNEPVLPPVEKAPRNVTTTENLGKPTEKEASKFKCKEEGCEILEPHIHEKPGDAFKIEQITKVKASPEEEVLTPAKFTKKESEALDEAVAQDTLDIDPLDKHLSDEALVDKYGARVEEAKILIAELDK